MREITSPSGAQWEIVADGHRAVIVEVGGGVREYTVHGEDVLDPYGRDEMCPGAAGQILAPWPNRIRDGHYTFEGEQYQLALTEPGMHNAAHGLTRWLPWTPVDVAPDAVTLECRLAAQPGYPWPLTLRTTWSLSADGLRADHTARNDGVADCPFGLGAHPYLRIDGVPVDDLVLEIPAQSRLLVDARLLPMGAAKVAGGPFDFVTARRIGDARLDTAFGDVIHGEDGVSRAVLASPDGTRVRQIWADVAFGWWQVYTGDTLQGDRIRRSVAVEPMTCPPDAFRSHRDVVTITPGGTWHGSWGVRAGRAEGKSA